MTSGVPLGRHLGTLDNLGCHLERSLGVVWRPLTCLWAPFGCRVSWTSLGVPLGVQTCPGEHLVNHFPTQGFGRGEDSS